MKKVITYGTFDLFHEGHRQILAKAKKLGDYLIVGVTSDYYDIQRGKMNVQQPLVERIGNIQKSGFADEILVEEHEAQKIADIQKYNINIFAIGSDWRGRFDFLKEYCEVVYLDRTPNISSTSLRDGRYGIVRLGFIGLGDMASRMAHELKFVSGVHHHAVYDPVSENAASFAKKHEFDTSYYEYDELLDNVDAVYIDSAAGTHFDYILSALNANKHVLCESPMTLSCNEANYIFDLAKEKGLVLMEAVRTAYAPGFTSLLAIAKNGRIGKIKDAEAAITKLSSPESNGPDIGGSFTRLASTTLLPIIKLLGRDYTDLSFSFFSNNDNNDLYTKAYFKFNGAIATAKTGTGVKSEGQLLISGTKGYILVKSPWWLTKAFEVCYEDPSENEHFSAAFPGYGMRFELADFIRNIRTPESENYKLSPADSIALADIMEKFLQAKKNGVGEIK